MTFIHENAAIIHSMYWKTNMFTNFQNKAMGFGVGTLVSSAQKRGCFQRGSLTQGPRDHMERSANTREKTLVGNTNIPHGN